jgi:L-rhamnose mutarotase
MHIIGSRMKLFKGFEKEYQKRHDEIWPQLVTLLHAAGIREYYIFLDEASLDLFAILKTDDPDKLNDLPSHPVMQRWWQYMKDIMETNPDGSPVNIPLRQVFALK